MNNIKYFFDSDFSKLEQLPKKFTASFDSIKINGEIKTKVSVDGVQVGNFLDDNSYEKDFYRFHDVFHYTFATILGWSPCTRAIMKRKRKSDPVIDNVEDGARAIITEEAISLILFNRAKRNNFFQNNNISPDILELVKELTTSFEVSIRSKEEWKEAVSKAYSAFRELVRNDGGKVHFDMLEKSVVYEN